MTDEAALPQKITDYKAAVTRDRRKAILRIVPRQLLERAIDSYHRSLSNMTRKECEQEALLAWEQIEYEIFRWLNSAKADNS